jgi:hypothetical protein
MTGHILVTMKHAENKLAKIVIFVAKAMLKPQLIGWYQADQTCIDQLTLEAYLLELASLTLDKNWAHQIQEAIFSSRQGDCISIDWKIEVENLNAILATSAPLYALTKSLLKNQLPTNLNSKLWLKLNSYLLIVTALADWTVEVKEQDDQMRADDAMTQQMNDANTAVHLAQ